MKNKLLIGASVLAILIGITSVLAKLTSSNNANFPNGAEYICQDCGHTWTMSMKDLSDHHKAHFGQPLACPKCGKTNTARGETCPGCGTIFKADRGGGGTCPKCGKSVYGGKTQSVAKPAGKRASAGKMRNASHETRDEAIMIGEV